MANGFAVDGPQSKRSTHGHVSGRAKVTPQRPSPVYDEVYEFPSAVPQPLRRVSRESNGVHTLRQKFEQGDTNGLGISFGDEDGEAQNISPQPKDGVNTLPPSERKTKLKREEINTREQLDYMTEHLKQMHLDTTTRLTQMNKNMDRIQRELDEFRAEIASLTDRFQVAADAAAAGFADTIDKHMDSVTKHVVDSVRPVMEQDIQRARQNGEVHAQRVIQRIDRFHEQFIIMNDKNAQPLKKVQERMDNLENRFISMMTEFRASQPVTVQYTYAPSDK